jgi:hypothetical protein
MDKGKVEYALSRKAYECLYGKLHTKEVQERYKPYSTLVNLTLAVIAADKPEQSLEVRLQLFQLSAK